MDAATLPGVGAETIESMRARHREVARYRMYHFDCKKLRKEKKTEIKRGLVYSDALAQVDALNGKLRAEDLARFTDPSYGFELTNAWDCMSETAKRRRLSLGDKPSDFNL